MTSQQSPPSSGCGTPLPPGPHLFRPATPASAASAAPFSPPQLASPLPQAIPLQTTALGGADAGLAMVLPTGRSTPSSRALLSAGAGSGVGSGFVGTASPLTSSVTLPGLGASPGAHGAGAAGSPPARYSPPPPEAPLPPPVEGSVRPLLAGGREPTGEWGAPLGSAPGGGSAQPPPPPSEMMPCGVELASIVEGPQAYHMGIIDILQVWSLRKRLERLCKTMLLGKPGGGISASPPLDYAQRFTERVICDVFDAPLSGGPSSPSATPLAAQGGRASPHQSQCPYHGVPPAAVSTSSSSVALMVSEAAGGGGGAMSEHQPSLRATANSHTADADTTGGQQ